MDLIPMIYHEQQQGQLCAQHALNNLLQQQLYSPVDLSDLGKQLDLKEVEFGLQESTSQNYDDSGFFSIQVMQQALLIFNLELVPLNSTTTKSDNANGYIANLNQHWFTLRKFGNSNYRWYNLNSTLKTPLYVSQTYLDLLINQIQQDGYSVYYVFGDLPNCDADVYCSENPIPAPEFMKFSTSGDEESEKQDLDPEVRKAIEMSLQEGDTDQVELAIQASLGFSNKKMKLKHQVVDDEEQEMEKAIKMSMMSSNTEEKDNAKKETRLDSQPNLDMIREKRLLRLSGNK